MEIDCDALVKIRILRISGVPGPPLIEIGGCCNAF